MTAPRAKAKELLTWAQERPVEWIGEALGAKPWKRQAGVIESVRDNRITAVRSCHGVGKSWVAAIVALWFLYTHPESIVWTTAPTFRQTEKIVWPELRLAHARARRALGGKPNLTELTLGEKWFAFGLSADNPDNLQGLHARYILGIVDEASGVSPEMWQAVWANMSGGHARLLAIGNPTDAESEFAKLFMREDVTKIVISAFDTPNFTEPGITLDDIRSGEWRAKQLAYIGEHGDLPAPHLVQPSWVRMVWETEGEDSPFFRSRVLAEFPEASPDTLISLRDIEAAQNRTLLPGLPIRIGIDVARQGTDSSVICLRRGPVARIAKRVHGLDTTEVGDQGIDVMENSGADCANIDMGAMGPGVYDYMRRKKKKVCGVNFGEGAVDDRKFVNLKAEIFWSLRTLFKDGDIDIDPKDARLATQLSALRYKVQGHDERIIMVKKDETRKLLNGASPDDADALAIAFAQTKESTRRYSAFVRNI